MPLWPFKPTTPITTRSNPPKNEPVQQETHLIPQQLGTVEPGETGESVTKLQTSDTSSGKMARTFVGLPLAVIGKIAGGVIGGTLALSAGIIGGLGAGMGWMAIGATGGDKFARQQAAAKGGEIGIPFALAAGALLTPFNATAKFVESFGKKLIPEDAELPDVYNKFDKSFETHVFPFCMKIGKKAVIYQAKDELAAKAKVAEQKAEIKAIWKESQGSTSVAKLKNFFSKPENCTKEVIRYALETTKSNENPYYLKQFHDILWNLIVQIDKKEIEIKRETLVNASIDDMLENEEPRALVSTEHSKESKPDSKEIHIQGISGKAYYTSPYNHKRISCSESRVFFENENKLKAFFQEALSFFDQNSTKKHFVEATGPGPGESTYFYLDNENKIRSVVDKRNISSPEIEELEQNRDEVHLENLENQ